MSGNFNGLFFVGVNQGQQRFSETCHVPLSDGGLIAKSIATLNINGTVYCLVIIDTQHCAGAIIDGFTGDGSIIGVHYAMDETNTQPIDHKPCMTVYHSLQ